MMPLRHVLLVAAQELTDSIRSRRALALLLLYLAGSIAGTILFVNFLEKIEGQLLKTLSLAPAPATGSVTATLWKSKGFRELLSHLVGNRDLAERLLDIPPLGLFYAWLSLTFAPLLVVLTSSARIVEEIWSGSVRFALFRTTRSSWIAGKILGQALLTLAALLLSAAGAWLVGWIQMDSFQPLATAQAMLLFALKSWIYALAFLGLATGISQVVTSPNVATALGMFGLMVIGVCHPLAAHYAGDGVRRLWDLVDLLLPPMHRFDLWYNSPEHLVPGIMFLLTLGTVYALLGYAFFARRDL